MHPSGSQESFSGYRRLAAQAMLQTAMEAEATEFIGRMAYERRQEDQALYRNGYPRAMQCLAKSCEECLTCLKLPEAHRRRVRTTNGLERLIEEARRRTQVQGVMGGERAGLSLIYAVTVDVAKRWRGIRMTPGDLEKLNRLRAEVAPLAKTA